MTHLRLVKSVLGQVLRLLPCAAWLPELRNWATLRGDMVAGISVAMVMIPQAMAYAELAGLPPVFGLYAASLPPVVAAFFGSSRQLSTGPVAMAALISVATVAPLAPPGSDAFITYSITLALMVGLIRLALGFLRLGMLVNLLSAPVVAGFTSAAALIIVTSQLHHLLGVPAALGSRGSGFHFAGVWQVLESAAERVHEPTVAMGLLAVVVILALGRWVPQAPAVLVAVTLTTALSWLLAFEGNIVGEVPGGLPSLQLPAIDGAAVPNLVVGALTITLIGLLEAMSIAKTIATGTKQRLDINQELVGQGLANVAGSFLQSFAVSGSFSRSAINLASGARTGFSSAVTSLAVIVTLLFLTPLLFHLPQTTLAAIIATAVLGFLRVEPLRTAWRASRADGVIAVITFAATLLLAPRLHLGVGIGVALSLTAYLYRSMRPRVVYLSRHADGTLRDADAHGLALDQRIAILRFDGRLYFGDSGYFEEKVLEVVTRLPELRYLVIDAGSINQVDASGELTLRQVVERLRGADIDVFFTRAKPQFVDVLERTGAIEAIGRDHFFAWNQHALEYLWDQMEPTYRARCPLNVATPHVAAGTWNI